MKAQINKEGILIINSENELEAYALGKWHAENHKNGKYENIAFDWSKIGKDVIININPKK